MRIELSKHKDESSRARLAELLDRAMGDFGSVISGWIGEKQELVLLADTDKVQGLTSTVYIVFSEAGEELGEAQIATSEIRKAYPKIKRYIPTPLPVLRSHLELEQGRDVNRKFFAKRDKRLKIVWNDDLSQQLIPFPNLCKLIFGNILSGCGEVSISRISDAWFEDEEINVERYNLSQLLWVHLTISDEQCSWFSTESVCAFAG